MVDILDVHFKRFPFLRERKTTKKKGVDKAFKSLDLFLMCVLLLHDSGE